MNFNLKSRLLFQFLLIGITPLLMMGSLSYYLASQAFEVAAIEKLESVQEVKKNAVEQYFKTIENQMLTFSENRMIVEASKDFKESFFNFGSDNSWDEGQISNMRDELRRYYRNDFDSEYKNQNQKNSKFESYLSNLDSLGVALQHQYISTNSNPLGSKHLLDRADDGSAYSKQHAKYHPIIKNYLEKFGYYDIFIVDHKTGHIIYSVFKELDFATSLSTGSFADTNFAKTYKLAAESSDKNFIHLVDYAQYPPSYEAPASFIASPIFDGSEKVAVAVFQMPIDRLNLIMNDRAGMGDTGETILVGSDYKPRSDSFLDENRKVFNAYRRGDKGSIVLPEVDEAIRGNSGSIQTVNYLGQDVLSSYTPVDVIGLRWALFSQKSVQESFAAVDQLGQYVLFIALTSIILNVLFGMFVGKGIAGPILGVAEKLGVNARKFSDASDSLLGSSKHLTGLATDQSSSIEETAASIEEISATIKNNVEQAEESARLSEQVKSMADSGNESMTDLIHSMDEITDSNEKIQELVRVIGEIGEKTEIIDDIVFQTKLLSFNASVEAERAGEHGRGFAVVAQEVGNLAQMSGKASLEIAAMVKQSIKDAETITSENKKKVDVGAALVKSTAKYLREIVNDAEHLSQQSNQIVTSSKEQSDGIEQVNEAMNSLDQATQQNLATADLTSRSSQQLANQADSLSQSVGQLLKMVHGRGVKFNLKNNSLTHKSETNFESSTGGGNLYQMPARGEKNSTANVRELKMVSGDEASKYTDDSWEKM